MGPFASSTLKTGTRKNVKSGIEKIIKLICEGYKEHTGKQIPPKMVDFISAFVWAWIDFIDEARLHKGKLTAKDAGIFAVKRALVVVGLNEGEYVECGVSLASAIVTLFDNLELITNSSRMAVVSVEVPIVSAAFASVALGASVVVGYEFLEAKNKCEPIIVKLLSGNGGGSKNTEYTTKMKWFQLEYKHQRMCSAGA